MGHKAILGLLGLVMALGAQAASVSVGHLSRDEGSGVIGDSLHQREWLGWDVTRGFTLAQTLAATAAGGAFAGFQLAHVEQAHEFAIAMFGPDGWSASSGQIWRNHDDAAVPLLHGRSYYDNAWAWGEDFDYAFYLSDNGVGQEVGILESMNRLHGTDRFAMIDEWYSVEHGADYWARQTEGSIGWLLYRDIEPAAAVPEPAALGLAGLALLGAGAVRRRGRRMGER